jgi:dienelactone hydrolase
MPVKTPLNAVIHGRIEQPEYTIEKVYFESFPGFYVTGNLYRPATVSGRVPGILSPHGHWANGRFYDSGEAAVLRDIVQGAERFEDGGRSPMQARAVQLAKMGCVVFHYDMIGYADCQQISFEIAHRFAKQRPEMNRAEGWGLYSPQAESNLQSVMGLQTWNSIRALDFLESLPDVDPQRLAATGASGGGTQTFMLAAVDPRLAVSFPAVMVSTAMQGGCTCENACLLRVGTGNIELAGLFAPKPQATDRRRRLDSRNGDQRLSAIEAAVRDVRRCGQRPPAPVRLVPAQLQLCQPRRDVSVDQPALPTRAADAGRRRTLPTLDGRCADGLERGPSEAAGR